MIVKSNSQTAQWRKRCFNQEVFDFETVDATATIGEEHGLRICFGQSGYRTIEDWLNCGDTFCIDFGQNWYLFGVRAKINAVLVEMGIRGASQ
jgi:hypothetical protein|tara:strand:+ start:288 stop:566 length:279 start_codon:yes stop_codon:yes gene_type:complete